MPIFRAPPQPQQPPPKIIPASNPDVTVSLTGVASTLSAGTLAPSNAVALSGVATTSSVGTLSPSTTVVLTGVSITSAAGTITATISGNVTVALTGAVITSRAGTIVASGGDVPTGPMFVQTNPVESSDFVQTNPTPTTRAVHRPDPNNPGFTPQ